MTPNTKATAKTRTTKTPEQRAIERYDVQARIVQRLTDKLDPARKAVATVEVALAAAKARLTYLAANPDLPEGYVDTPLPEGDADNGDNGDVIDDADLNVSEDAEVPA